MFQAVFVAVAVLVLVAVLVSYRHTGSCFRCRWCCPGVLVAGAVAVVGAVVGVSVVVFLPLDGFFWVLCSWLFL